MKTLTKCPPFKNASFSALSFLRRRHTLQIRPNPNLIVIQLLLLILFQTPVHRIPFIHVIMSLCIVVELPCIRAWLHAGYEIPIIMLKYVCIIYKWHELYVTDG